MSTQTIAQSNGISIKKKKTKSKKGQIAFRGLVLPILVLHRMANDWVQSVSCQLNYFHHHY